MATRNVCNTGVAYKKLEMCVTPEAKMLVVSKFARGLYPVKLF